MVYCAKPGPNRLNQEWMGTAMTEQATNAIPVLPLRDVVVYPHMVIPLFVGREKSINALDTAMQEDKKILLVAQKKCRG